MNQKLRIPLVFGVLLTAMTWLLFFILRLLFPVGTFPPVWLSNVLASFNFLSGVPPVDWLIYWSLIGFLLTQARSEPWSESSAKNEWKAVLEQLKVSRLHAVDAEPTISMLGQNRFSPQLYTYLIELLRLYSHASKREDIAAFREHERIRAEEQVAFKQRIIWLGVMLMLAWGLFRFVAGGAWAVVVISAVLASMILGISQVVLGIERSRLKAREHFIATMVIPSLTFVDQNDERVITAFKEHTEQLVSHFTAQSVQSDERITGAFKEHSEQLAEAFTAQGGKIADQNAQLREGIARINETITAEVARLTQTLSVEVAKVMAASSEQEQRSRTALAEESERIRNTIQEEFRSGVLEAFLTRFRESAEAFETQTSRMLKRLHEKMVDVSENLRSTGDSLKVYVEKGGVADIALLHKALNDFRKTVNGMTKRFDKAEALIEELSVLPNAVERMAAANLSLKQAGERSLKVSDHIDELAEKLVKINETMASGLQRNDEISSATENAIEELGTEIAALKGSIASMSVNLAGIQQAVSTVQQLAQRQLMR
jgi:hypothetical protein